MISRGEDNLKLVPTQYDQSSATIILSVLDLGPRAFRQCVQ